VLQIRLEGTTGVESGVLAVPMLKVTLRQTVKFVGNEFLA